MSRADQARAKLGANVRAGEVWPQVHFAGSPGVGILSFSSYTSKQGLSQFLTLTNESLVTGCLGGRRGAKFPISVPSSSH